MNKTTAIVLSSFFALGLAGCGSDDTDQEVAVSNIFQETWDAESAEGQEDLCFGYDLFGEEGLTTLIMDEFAANGEMEMFPGIENPEVVVDGFLTLLEENCA